MNSNSRYMSSNESWLSSVAHSSMNEAKSGLSMNKVDARCESGAWDCLCVLNIQFLELSLVLGCILFIKLERVTNGARELSWARACALVHDRTSH